VTAGADGPTQLSRALLVISSTGVPFPVRTVAREVFEDHDYEVTEIVPDEPAGVGEVVDSNAGDYDVCAVIGGLRAGPQHDTADALRGVITAPLPGVIELIRGVQTETGYSRAVFENPAAGWVGSTLALTLPAEREALMESLVELLTLHADAGIVPTGDGEGAGSAGSRRPGAGRLGPAGSASAGEGDADFSVHPPDAGRAAELPEDENRPDATILRMPLPTRPPEDPWV